MDPRLYACAASGIEPASRATRRRRRSGRSVPTLHGGTRAVHDEVLVCGGANRPRLTGRDRRDLRPGRRVAEADLDRTGLGLEPDRLLPCASPIRRFFGGEPSRSTCARVEVLEDLRGSPPLPGKTVRSPTARAPGRARTRLEHPELGGPAGSPGSRFGPALAGRAPKASAARETRMRALRMDSEGFVAIARAAAPYHNVSGGSEGYPSNRSPGRTRWPWATAPSAAASPRTESTTSAAA